MTDSVVGPKSAFQEKYLNCNSNIIIAGGAMGSSKSYIGLMRHLRWVHDPQYRGFCVRKNSTTIMRSGGLFEDALHLYRQVYPNVIPKYKDQKIVFPSGATVSFSHYENDKDSEKWRGIQASSYLLDEGSDLEEHWVWFLISRLRTRAKMTPSLWLTTNPTPDHWLRKIVDYWLYPEDHPKFGLPDPEKQGLERWITRKNGEILWGESKEEVIYKHGDPDLPLDHKDQIKPMSITCLFGTVYDNPPLLESQPQYLSNLENLPEIEKRRNLYGDWEARIEAATYFQRSWCEEITAYDPSEITKLVRAWDFAATLKSDAIPSPDYTVSVLMAKTKTNDYIVLDVRRMRIRPGDWETQIVDAWEYDRQICGNVVTIIPQDPGASGQMATSILCRALAERGIVTEKMRASGKKLDRFRPFSASSQVGSVKFLKGCGNDYENKVVNDNGFVYRELEAFDGLRRSGEHGHDRIVVVYKPI